jgi:hypothetical protein
MLTLHARPQTQRVRYLTRAKEFRNTRNVSNNGEFARDKILLESIANNLKLKSLGMHSSMSNSLTDTDEWYKVRNSQIIKGGGKALLLKHRTLADALALYYPSHPVCTLLQLVN